MQWLTPAGYRLWRDTGLRGYRADGLPDEGFRGRWASRNVLFADVMVRTGLRLAEQASLTVLEVPADDGGVAYQRFWLPEAVAKNRSSRWVYLPAALARKVGEYCAADRDQPDRHPRERAARAWPAAVRKSFPALRTRAHQRRDASRSASGAAVSCYIYSERAVTAASN